MIRFINSVLIFIFVSFNLLSTSVAEPATIDLSNDFTHLLNITTDQSKVFDAGKVNALIQFAASEKFLKSTRIIGGLKDIPSEHYGFYVKSSLKRLLKYCYNSQIPGCAVLPGYVRLSKWEESTVKNNDTGELWEKFNTLKEPVVKKGTLYMQNTPDINTGAYYGYDSFKTGILLKNKKKNIFISVSKQKNISEVGKKGFIVGSDKNPDYFYSGEPGLNKFGLGSIKSYLYDAFSVTIYVESEPEIIKCISFKWLKAGWAGMNMIKPEHIKKGLLRFAFQQKDLLESDKLPSYDRLMSTCSKYNTLPENKIKLLMKTNLNRLVLACNNSSNCPKYLNKDFNLDIYISRMTKDEMKASLLLQDIKILYRTDDHKPLTLSHKK